MSKKKKWEALNEAIRQDDAAKVKEAAAGLSLARSDEYYQACLKAVRLGAGKALDALMDAGGGYNFSSKVFDSYNEKEPAENHQLASALITEAFSSPNPEPVFLVLYKNRARGNLGDYSTVPVGKFLNEDSSISLLDACLKSKAYSAFSESVDKVGLFSTPKLDFILTFSSVYDSEATLTRALITVATNGDVDKAALLLASGANADFDGAESLRIAAMNGHQEMVDLLLPSVSLKTYGEKIVTQLQYKDADPAVVQSIEDATKATGRKPVAEAAPAEEPVQPVQEAEQDDGFERKGNNLIETQTLPNGSTLMTVFNFTSRQQKTIVMNKDGNGPQPTLVSFDDLDDGVVDALQKKFDALGKPAAAAEPAKRTAQLRNIIR